MRTTPSISNAGAIHCVRAYAQVCAGVPPVPPEDSPKADAGSKRKVEQRDERPMDASQGVADRIAVMLARGGNAFRERWTRAASRGVPRNAMTGRAYHGANVLLLWDAAIEHGYDANVWLTYRQALVLGAQVRRGEKAVMCAHLGRQGPSGRAPEDIDEVAHSGHPPSDSRECRSFWLFNVAQVDGLPRNPVHGAPGVLAAQKGVRCSPIEGALRLIGGCSPDIRHGFEHSAYAPRADRILMPDVNRFTSHETYCATVLHELVHWTGHPSRLARAFGKRFGDAAYAFEELVAELGSAFVLGHIGLLDASVEGHASYSQVWLHLLRNDPTAIFTAARHASDAAAYILAREMPAVGGGDARQA